MVGAQPLMDLIVNLGPAPGDRGPAVGNKPGDAENAIERPIADDQPVSVVVFKTFADPFAGKLSLIHVRSGVLKGDSSVINVRADSPERLGQLQVAQGKQVTTPDGFGGSLSGCFG